jgi:acyl-CoA synthetase (AMP-forming)/AMP-acid ligase II
MSSGARFDATSFVVLRSISRRGASTGPTARNRTSSGGRPDLTAEALTDGWFRTGDGGALEDGYLRITDRKKEVIITGGENVSSLEVEACIHRHPRVHDVAIIGVPHSRWGETPKAVVVLKPGEPLGERELIAFCRKHLAHFKSPTSVEFVDDLPRTATGKVQKYVLRERHVSHPTS